MIFNKTDIIEFLAKEKSGETTILKSTKLHKPTGVYFMASSDEETKKFLYFTIGAMNSKSEPENKKTFEGNAQKDFFAAVDYFEGLIQKRMPDEKQKPPSIGQFVYIKGLDCLVLAFGIETVIDYEDVPTVFTPPQKKPYGRLNMMDVEKEKYDIIKAKFALNFNQESTDEWKAKLSNDDVVVYDMTAYQTSEPQEGEEPAEDPEGVNDDELTADEIEGEDEESMKGSDSDEDSESDSESDEHGKGDSDGESDANGDSDEDSESDGDGTESKEGDNENDDELNERDEGDEMIVDAPEAMQQSKDTQPLIIPSSGVVINKLNEAFAVEDVVENFRRQEVMLNLLKGWTDDQMKEKFYDALGTPRNTPVKDFIEELKNVTKPYWE